MSQIIPYLSSSLSIAPDFIVLFFLLPFAIAILGSAKSLYVPILILPVVEMVNSFLRLKGSIEFQLNWIVNSFLYIFLHVHIANFLSIYLQI